MNTCELLQIASMSCRCADRVFVSSAWQEVMQQQEEQGPEEAQGAVPYKETTPSPHMDSEYFSSSSPQSSSHLSILFKFAFVAFIVLLAF